jgi:hypothetical protein
MPHSGEEHILEEELRDEKVWCEKLEVGRVAEP